MNRIPPEQISLLCSKTAAGCGILSSGWVWLGTNSDQIASIAAIVCAVIAVLTYIKGRK